MLHIACGGSVFEKIEESNFTINILTRLSMMSNKLESLRFSLRWDDGGLGGVESETGQHLKSLKRLHLDTDYRKGAYDTEQVVALFRRCLSEECEITSAWTVEKYVSEREKVVKARAKYSWEA